MVENPFPHQFGRQDLGKRERSKAYGRSIHVHLIALPSHVEGNRYTSPLSASPTAHSANA